MTTKRVNDSEELIFELPHEPAHRPERYALPKWLVDQVIATEWAYDDRPRHPRESEDRRSLHRSHRENP
jgi:hypothetical protein